VYHQDSSRLGQALRAGLEAWIPAGSRVALLDVPVNRNAGDLFCLAATVRMLEDFGCRLVYRAGVRDYRSDRARRVIGTGTTIVCSGGGNFGDLYPRYQALRERVVADFPDNRIVVLPQSVWFGSRDRLESSAARLARHRDLRVAVRDRPSERLIRRYVTEQVLLLPDIVHWSESGELTRPPSAREGALALLRRDAGRGHHRVPEGYRRADWSDLLPGLTRRVAAAAAMMPLAPAGPSARLHDGWSAYARELLRRALDRLRAVERLLTDRLHGAILARLAGTPVVLIDNSYGKMSAYFDAWWREARGVELASPGQPVARPRVAWMDEASYADPRRDPR
jgi:pyruvyl transferase EpsO